MAANGKSGGAPSRLDGLLGLLDGGANSSVRRMAAKQIGELVASHPLETRPVLKRVRRFLRSSAWETRVAAGYALAAIADQSPSFAPKHESTSIVSQDKMQDPCPVKAEPQVADVSQPKPNVKQEGSPTMADEEQVSVSKYTAPTLILDKLDVLRVMESGALLFGSTGAEYQAVEGDVQKQRARLRKDLGIDDRFSSGADMLGLKDEDLTAANKIEAKDEVHPMQNSTVNDMNRTIEGISARERNRLKREAKKRAKQGSDITAMRPMKRLRTATGAVGPAEEFSLRSLANEERDDEADMETEFGSDWWDFQPTCEVLKRDLLHPRWEMRHGAAVGIREVVKRHAASPGRFSRLDGRNENEMWLEDLCCRLIFVLAMDRFGDFVGDAVVAPVRETAAMIIKDPKKWEARHAGLLGIRYIIAVRQDLSTDLLGKTIEPILEGLQDQDDDVRAAAGEALIPVAQAIVD
eukprot:IDg10240t1